MPVASQNRNSRLFMDVLGKDRGAHSASDLQALILGRRRLPPGITLLSGADGSGKTALSALLASVFSSSGQKVVHIDCVSDVRQISRSEGLISKTTERIRSHGDYPAPREVTFKRAISLVCGRSLAYKAFVAANANLIIIDITSSCFASNLQYLSFVEDMGGAARRDRLPLLLVCGRTLPQGDNTVLSATDYDLETVFTGETDSATGVRHHRVRDHRNSVSFDIDVIGSCVRPRP
jgi:hypothetical protein